MTASTKPDRQSAAAAEARGARLLVGIIGGGFLLLIAAFVGMIFFVHDEARLNAVGRSPPHPAPNAAAWSSTAPPTSGRCADA
jgi:hypothetical protein